MSKTSRTLRLAVVADDPTQAGWVVEAIERLASEQLVELVAIVPAGVAAAKDFLPAVIRPLLAQWWRSSPADPASGYPETVEAEDYDLLVEIRSCRRDDQSPPLHPGRTRVIVTLGEGSPYPPGAIEVFDGEETSAVVMEWEWGSGGERRGWREFVGRTIKYQPARNAAALRARGTHVVERALRSFAANPGTEGLSNRLCLSPGWRSKVSRPDRPLWHRILAMGRRRIVGKVVSLGASVTWEVGVGRRGAQVTRFPALLGPNVEGFCADPCLVQGDDGSHCLFVESFRDQDGYGKLSVATLDASGRVSALEEALDTKSHLSFPGVFKADGRWFLLPEAASSGRVTLYESVQWPHGWRPAATLLRLPLIDPVLHQQDGMWYLFGTMEAAGVSCDDELHLFVSPTLTGPYVAHPCSPIVTDVRAARMAGQILTTLDGLVRPAQDCGPRYGAGLRFFRVKALTPTAYVEEEVEFEMPPRPKGAIGQHSVSLDGDWMATDFLVRSSLPDRAVAWLRDHLR